MTKAEDRIGFAEAKKVITAQKVKHNELFGLDGANVSTLHMGIKHVQLNTTGSTMHNETFYEIGQKKSPKRDAAKAGFVKF